MCVYFFLKFFNFLVEEDHGASMAPDSTIVTFPLLKKIISSLNTTIFQIFLHFQ